MAHQTSSQAVSASRRGIEFLIHAMVDRIPTEPRSADQANIVDQVPALNVGDHLMAYEGCAMDKNKFVWGLYGTATRVHSHGKLLAFATAAEKQLLLIRGHFSLDSPGLLRSGHDRNAVMATGFMHADHLKKAFRDEVKESLLPAAKARFTGFEQGRHESVLLGDLLLAFPELVQEVFDMYPNVNIVVHRVRPSWDANSKRGIPICTMRRIPERIRDVMLPYLPKLSIGC